MKTVICPITGELTEYTDEEFYEKKTSALLAWKAAYEQIQKLKEIEQAARFEYVSLAGNPAKMKGTEYDELGNGWKCKITKTPNFGFIKDGRSNDLKAINAALGRIADEIPDGARIAGEVVRWSPTLSVGTYDELSPEAKLIINEIIIQNRSSVSLEIIPPKEKK